MDCDSSTAVAVAVVVVVVTLFFTPHSCSPSLYVPSEQASRAGSPSRSGSGCQHYDDKAHYGVSKTKKKKQRKEKRKVTSDG